MSRRAAWPLCSLIVSCILCAGLTGCEALQRKFTRKPKHAAPPPKPIVIFQDYSRAMTPIERYRKHYLIFDYWNDELIEALQSPPLNPKRFRRASTEALGELEVMQQLVADDLTARLGVLIEERATVDRQLKSPSFSEAQAGAVRWVLEAQTRQINREFFWRQVEDRLKPSDAPRD